jgi:hypothetical protein
VVSLYINVEEEILELASRESYGPCTAGRGHVTENCRPSEPELSSIPFVPLHFVIAVAIVLI